MKRADRPAEAGYTIVETMIFLIVTGVLMASAALLFNGKISRSQFVQGVRQFNNSVANTLNAVSTGTYDNNHVFTCTAGGSTRAPQVSSAGSANNQGTNTGCIIAGQVIHGNLPGNQGQVNTYTVIANRVDGSGSNIAGLADPSAHPIVLDDYSTGGSGVDLTQTQTLPAGLKVTRMIALGATGNTNIGAVGVFQTFGQDSVCNGSGLQSGAQNVLVLPISRDPAGNGVEQTGSLGIDHYVASSLCSSPPDVSKGVLICLSDGSQYGTITIGLSNSNLTTTVNIGQDTRCPAA